MGKRRARRRYFIDPKVQGALAVRAAKYWCLSLMLVGGLTALGWLYVSPGIGRIVASRDLMAAVVSALAFSVLAAVLVFPLVVMDFIRMSNRFAGPVFRLRRAMRDAAAGLPVEPLRFRDDDFWQDVADEFNALLARLPRGARPSDPPCCGAKRQADVETVVDAPYAGAPR